MSWVETAIRTLFAFNGFLLLVIAQFFLLKQVLSITSISWLPGALFVAAWASLVWVLYRECQLPAGPVPTAGHVVWVLSGLGYIWLGGDPTLTYIDHVGLDFSKPTDFEKMERFQLLWTSIYVLLSTTGLAWLLRVVGARRSNASQFQFPNRMSGLLLSSICAMLAFLSIKKIGGYYNERGSNTVLPYFMVRDEVLLSFFFLAWLLVAIEVARGNKMAFRVGVAELLIIML